MEKQEYLLICQIIEKLKENVRFFLSRLNIYLTWCGAVATVDLSSTVGYIML